MFDLPQKVLKLVQSACRTFLWTGRAEPSKRALVAWDNVMLPLQSGGLNIHNLKIWNKAAICKLLWSLNQKQDKIWIRWVHGYYIRNQNVFDMNMPVQSSWIIQKIIGAREHLKNI